MGIVVPVYTGVEYLSKSKYGGNLSRVTKVKRGYYEAEFEVLAENTIGINYEITNLF
jgi:KDO2-lipid IV(A) lauroyltransferase